jgi:hypothetical protein
MWHHMIDEAERNPKQYRWYQRHFWSFELPLGPRCWLLGHKPMIRWNGGMSFMECARCPARPQDREQANTFTHVMEANCGRADRFQRFAHKPSDEEMAQLEQWIFRDYSRRANWSHRKAEFKAEIPIPRKLRPEFSLRFHIGGRGSETPWDGHLTIFGAGIYWGLGLWGHTAHKLTGGRGRDMGVQIHNRTLRWQLWDTPGEWSRDQPKWWQGHFSIDPTEWLWGRRRYTYDDAGEPVTVTVETAEGTTHDDVVLQLQHGWYGWEKRPRPRGRDRWSADWNSRTGIPVMHHEWKGDEILGSSVELTTTEAKREDWPRIAAEKIRAQATDWRIRYGWSRERYERDRAGAA